MKWEIEEFGASDGPRRLRSQSDVNLDARKKEEQQDFRDLQYEREK